MMSDRSLTGESLSSLSGAENSPEAKLEWGSRLTAVVCEHCDWRFLHIAEKNLMRCPFCFRSSLSALDQDEVAHLIIDPPELYLSFSANLETINKEIHKFVSEVRFAPKDLSIQNLQSRLTRVFFPNWLVDVDANANWESELGYDYQVVSHRERFNQNSGRWKTQEFTETRTRWEQRVGRLNRKYHNIRAPGLEEDAELGQRIGNYDTSKVQQYIASVMTNTYVSLPSRSKEDAWPAAVPSIQSAAASECLQAATADHIRQFRWKPTYDNLRWTLLLLPMYTTYYMDDDNIPQVVLINGQSGRLNGTRKASMNRARQTSLIIIFVAALIFLLSIAVALGGLLLPPLIILGGIGILIAILLGVMAVIPVGVVWQFNRKEKT